MNIDDLDLSPELREKARACKTPEELFALAKREGHKLSEDEMEAISGGGDAANWACSQNDAPPKRP